MLWVDSYRDSLLLLDPFLSKLLELRAEVCKSSDSDTDLFIFLSCCVSISTRGGNTSAYITISESSSLSVSSACSSNTFSFDRLKVFSSSSLVLSSETSRVFSFEQLHQFQRTDHHLNLQSLTDYFSLNLD
eukprot:TRINITY_DN4202_c0_g1_i4.p3 TRINITY_DN4202_c0_g1~~TRINITY_DN4202_c0_g1_i4.p3  ORF type:complete len:131 (-),score=10.81 TRINITY_DN4202_c0_g1_i4:317-709(-)